MTRRTQSCTAAQAAARLAQARAKRASSALRRLINLKDKSHYGFTNVSASDRQTALTSARRVVEFAEQTLR